MDAATYSTRITTSGRLAIVESWLRQNAKSGWEFKLKDISDDMSKKTYDIVFKDKVDYELFRHRFPPTGTTKAAPEPTTEAPETEDPPKTDVTAVPEPETAPPDVKPELGTYLKYTAGNFVSALAKAFASKSAEDEKVEAAASTLPASFRSKSSSSSS